MNVNSHVVTGNVIIPCPLFQMSARTRLMVLRVFCLATLLGRVTSFSHHFTNSIRVGRLKARADILDLPCKTDIMRTRALDAGCHYTTPQSPRRNTRNVTQFLRKASANGIGERGLENAASSVSASEEVPIISQIGPTEERLPPRGSSFLFEQRIESAKGAILCGVAASGSRLLAVGVGTLVPPVLRETLAVPEPAASALLFCLASGFVQGALFGLTYR